MGTVDAADSTAGDPFDPATNSWLDVTTPSKSKDPPAAALTSSIINSPKIRRRNHLQRVAVESSNSRTSWSNRKRVSFHQDQSIPLTPPATASTKRHYQSTWLLTDDMLMNKPVLSSFIRRYQSDLYLNQSIGEAASTSHLPERGVPEGQEDPGSFLNLSANREEVRRNSSFRAAPSFFLFKKDSPQQQLPKVCSTVEEKLALANWAQEKWARKIPNLPEPPYLNSSTINVDCDQKWQRMERDQQYKSFQCFVGFYHGKPCPTYLMMDEKAIHVSCIQNTTWTSPLWSWPIMGITDVMVKWNYSVLVINGAAEGHLHQSSGISNTFSVDFVDPVVLRNAASYLDVLLRNVQKRCDVVTVELPSQCQIFWASQKLHDINYVGTVYFEESFIMTAEEEDAFDVNSKSGHLMYRWSSNKIWHAGYFTIKEGVLYQFNQANDRYASYSTSLSELEGYGRNFHSSRPHTIEIQLLNGKCLLLASASEAEASDWLFWLSATDPPPRTPELDSRSPVACGILVTSSQIFLFQTPTKDVKLIASTPLEIISVMISKDGEDTFCLIEYDYQEAHEGAGDWILYFQSANSLEEFLRATQLPRQILSNETASILRNKSLIFSRDALLKQ